MPSKTRPGPEMLDEYVRRTVAGDRNALQALHAVLSPYVRDSAACLFGNGGDADIITDEVFADVWRLAHQYQPGGAGVPAWVLGVAGQHTMSRCRSDTNARVSGGGAGGAGRERTSHHSDVGRSGPALLSLTDIHRPK